MPRWIVDRLTYANTVATLALFIALGGVSYAAIAVPANSVGPAQLRARAVGTRGLDFPIGVTGVTDEKAEELAKTYCNSRIPPGVAIVLTCSPLDALAPVPGREVTLRVGAPGRLLLSAIVGLSSTGPAGADARVRLHFVLDRAFAGRGETVVVAGGEHVDAPVQAVIDVANGTHTVTLKEDVRYDFSQPGDVTVDPASLVVTELPRA